MKYFYSIIGLPKDIDRNGIIDRVIRNARVLGRMAATVEKCEAKHWLMTIKDELTIQRFYEIRSEQEQLCEILRKE